MVARLREERHALGMRIDALVAMKGDEG